MSKSPRSWQLNVAHQTLDVDIKGIHKSRHQAYKDLAASRRGSVELGVGVGVTDLVYQTMTSLEPDRAGDTSQANDVETLGTIPSAGSRSRANFTRTTLRIHFTSMRRLQVVSSIPSASPRSPLDLRTSTVTSWSNRPASPSLLVNLVRYHRVQSWQAGSEG